MMRTAIALAPLLALSGCSPGDARIRVDSRGSALVFTATRSTSALSFSRHAVDLQPDLVRIDHGGRIAWRIERSREHRCIDPGGGARSRVFPLTYGKVPDCFTEVVRAQSLAAGTAYRIAAVGGQQSDNGHGYFQLATTATNLDSEPRGLADWGAVEPVFNVAAAP